MKSLREVMRLAGRSVSKWAEVRTGTRGSCNRGLNPLVSRRGYQQVIKVQFHSVVFLLYTFPPSPERDDAPAVVSPSEHTA